jgi:hypothetical protein
VVVVAALSQMVMWSWGLINGVSDAGDEAAARSLSSVAYFGRAGVGIGVATAFIATGWGGPAGRCSRDGSPSRPSSSGSSAHWGDAGVPPGGLVTYVLLPVWLVTASVVVSRSQRRVAEPIAPAALATA